MKKNSWDVASIEKFFESATIPDFPVLISGRKVTDIKRFIRVHLALVKKHNGKKNVLPYWEWLLSLKKVLEGNPIPLTDLKNYENEH